MPGRCFASSFYYIFFSILFFAGGPLNHLIANEQNGRLFGEITMRFPLIVIVEAVANCYFSCQNNEMITALHTCLLRDRSVCACVCFITLHGKCLRTAVMGVNECKCDCIHRI